MPSGTFLPTNKIRVEEINREIGFYFLENGELICKHKLTEGENKIIPIEQQTVQGVEEREMEELFAGDDFYK